MRYIDADQLIKKIYPMGIGDGMYVINAKAVKFAIDNTPTADVVPKSEYDVVVSAVDNSTQEFLRLHDDWQEAKREVERLTVELDAMRGAANTYKMHYENAMKEIERLKDYNTGVAFKHYFDGRKEVAREIFEEIEKRSSMWGGERHINYKVFAELKKKYAEEKE